MRRAMIASVVGLLVVLTGAFYAAHYHDSTGRRTTPAPPASVQRRFAAQRPRAIVVFRCDDVSAFSDDDRLREILRLFTDHSIPLTLGIIPCRAADVFDTDRTNRCHISANREILDLLQRCHANGSAEIGLHGYAHQNNRIHSGHTEPGKCSEFRGLGVAAQERILKAGIQVMTDLFGESPDVFIPPWNTLDDNTIAAAVRAGFSIVSGEGTVFFGSAFQNGWTNIGRFVSCAGFADILERADHAPTEQAPSIHIVVFHPWEIDTDAKWHQLGHLLHRLRDSTYRAKTMSEARAEILAMLASPEGLE